MKPFRLLICIIALVCPYNLSAQLSYTKYWVQLTDKNNNPYSINNPSGFLSPRSIERRIKQNIPIAESDLPLTPSYTDSIRSTGAIIIHPSKWFNAVTVQITDSAILNKILSFPFVKKIDTVARMKKGKDIEAASLVPAATEKNFKSFGSDYGSAYNQTRMINTDILHELGYRGEGMVIAVLDNGFFNYTQMRAFDSLRLNNQVLGTWDFVEGNDTVDDDGMHGTWVLSTMAANLPGEIIGTAPKAKYWLLHTEVDAYEQAIEEDNWIAGAEFADSVGADIINSSLGYYEFDDPFMNYTYADMNGNTARVTIGADMAAGKGILVCNSAGNEGNSSWKYIIAPADGDSVLAVGAVDAAGKRASFSSVGPSSDGRIKPNIAAQGAKVAVANVDNSIAFIGGTSFSSPITAGSTACLWQAFPDKTNMEIIDAIQKSATQFNTPDSLLGYGIPDFYKAYTLLSPPTRNILTEKYTLRFFPNPCTDNFTVYFHSDTQQEAALELYDISARFIWSRFVPMRAYETVNMSQLSNGVYLLKIKIASYSYLVKIVKL